jgi:hypothetical protein
VRLLVTCILLFPVIVAAQDEKTTVSQDSLEKVRAQNRRIYAAPRKASIMSAIVPGLGQVYNRKYWKVPLIYGGLGGLGWLFSVNNTEYQFYRRNLKAVYDDDPATINETFYDADQLQKEKNYYKKIRDLAAIGMGAIYLLNIVDANVDAHLRTFDVSDDLSLRADPWFAPGLGAGLRVTLKFH